MPKCDFDKVALQLMKNPAMWTDKYTALTSKYICDALHDLVIWYHFYDLKNLKNTHRGVLLLVKLQAKSLLKLTFLYACFSHFLNCRNGTKSGNASHISDWPKTLK